MKNGGPQGGSEVLSGGMFAFLTWILFPQKLTGCEACDALEESGEMVGEVEAEQARGFADVMPLHQQTFRLINNIMMYISDGCAARGLVDDVAKVARRIGQH